MNCTSISQREAKVIEALTDRDLIVFRPREVRRFLGTSARNTYRILEGMVQKDLGRRISTGIYVLTEAGTRSSHDYDTGGPSSMDRIDPAGASNST